MTSDTQEPAHDHSTACFQKGPVAHGGTQGITEQPRFRFELRHSYTSQPDLRPSAASMDCQAHARCSGSNVYLAYHSCCTLFPGELQMLVSGRAGAPVASARVGRGFLIMLSSICVAVMTGLPLCVPHTDINTNISMSVRHCFWCQHADVITRYILI